MTSYRRIQTYRFHALSGPAAQNLIQDFVRVISFLLADFGFENRYQAPHLRLGQTDIKPDAEMSLELGVEAYQAGQSLEAGRVNHYITDGEVAAASLA